MSPPSANVEAKAMCGVDQLITITREALDTSTLTKYVTLPHCGAVSLFIGTTRDNFEGRKVKSLEYECYQPMAVKELQKICQQMREKWSDLGKIAIAHRLGLVPVCEASVVIAVSSPHRVQAMAAVHYCIDELKASVPIWKKELYEDGLTEWKENKECPWTRNT